MLALHRFLLLHLLTCLGLHALGSEIIHGREAKKNSLQYMVSVQSSGAHRCGGFLISDKFVVTAAHCDFNSMSVVIGTHDLRKVDNDTMRFEVKKCKNPSYENVGKGNDIMLLKLTKKVGLNKRVKLIDYPKKPKIKDNTKCIVAGWGFTETGGAAAHVLQEVDVSVINLKICAEEWKQKAGLQHFPDNVICAGGYNTDKGFCQGDSGGPLVCRGKAVGIVSFNMRRNCSYPNVPNVYTDLSKYQAWIKKILKQKDC